MKNPSGILVFSFWCFFVQGSIGAFGSAALWNEACAKKGLFLPARSLSLDLKLIQQAECLKRTEKRDPKRVADFLGQFRQRHYELSTTPVFSSLDFSADVFSVTQPKTLRSWLELLDRLSQKNRIWILTQDQTRTFLNLCEKQKPKEKKTCLPWGRRLANLVSKNSALYKTINKDLYKPDPPAPSYAKSTQNYRSQDSDLKAFDEAFAKYLEGDLRAATADLEKFLDDYPKSSQRHRARYWYAVALKKQGQEEKAKTNFEQIRKDGWLTYYGILAGFEVGRPVAPPSLDANKDPNPFSGKCGVQELHPSESKRLEQAYKLEKTPALLSSFLETFKHREAWSNECLEEFIRLQRTAQNFGAVFSALTEWLYRKVPAPEESEKLVTLIFPKPYKDEILSAANQSAIDPALLFGLIKQESGFDHDAQSSSNALGLMQLINPTALDMNEKINRLDLLFSTKTNIDLGTKYLSRLSQKYEQKMGPALGAYNGGPNNMDRWLLQKNQQQTYLEWVETIPYKESREYITSIMRNTYWYRPLLGLTPFVDQADFLKLFFN